MIATAAFTSIQIIIIIPYKLWIQFVIKSHCVIQQQWLKEGISSDVKITKYSVYQIDKNFRLLIF